IEVQRLNNVWEDVTMDILSLGIAGKNQAAPGACADPSPFAVIRIQRVRNVPRHGAVNQCGRDPGGPQMFTTDPRNYWPMVLYDGREGRRREDDSAAALASTNLYLSGVMHYIELDTLNLSRWFRGLIGTRGGATVLNVTGYTVYFSDRRNNKTLANQETGA